MKELVNLHSQPLPLDGGIDGGVILAAAGTEGSIRSVAELSDADHVLVERGLIMVRDKALRAVPPPKEEARSPSTVANDASSKEKN